MRPVPPSLNFIDVILVLSCTLAKHSVYSNETMNNDVTESAQKTLI